MGPDRVAEVFLLFAVTMFLFRQHGDAGERADRKRANTATVVTYLLVLGSTLGLGLATVYFEAVGMTIGTGGTPLPLTAYFDPAFALAAVLPQLDSTVSFGFDFQIWQVDILASVVISVICVALSAVLLRQSRA